MQLQEPRVKVAPLDHAYLCVKSHLSTSGACAAGALCVTCVDQNQPEFANASLHYLYT
jgi:hypothetical protein